MVPRDIRNPRALTALQSAQISNDRPTIGDDDVRAVIQYYVAYKDELDEEIRRHVDAQQNYKRVLQQREAHARRRIASG